MRGSEIASIGMAVVLIGIIIILAGFAKDIIERGSREGAAEKGEIRGGGVILIGPFPIVFGTDRQSTASVIILSIILIVIVWIFMRGR